MLKKISIQNYALIEALEFEFDKGLTMITGETGSGKSIILGALGLILGERADTSALRNREQKCIVEAVFDLTENSGLEQLFDDLDLDFESTTFIRREINPKGKSRAFVNDTPTTLAELKEIGANLVDVHVQHQTLLLNKKNYQLGILDSYGQHSPLLNAYREVYLNYKAVSQELEALKEKEKQAALDRDYLQFQFEELEKTALQPNESKVLEEELNRLNSAEDIKILLQKTSATLDHDEMSLLAQLQALKNEFQRYEDAGESYRSLAERLQSVHIELKDIVSEAETLSEGVEYDPQRIEEVNERINLIYSLQQKHRVQDEDELIQRFKEIEAELMNINSLEEVIADKEKEFKQLESTLSKKAEELTSARKKAAPKMEQAIHHLLKELSMPHATLQIEMAKLEEFQPHGKDGVTFQFKANKGGNFAPIQKVASGGELSRLMLSIKALLAEKTVLPTLILDEIDTGVSGEVADKMGKMLKTMSTNLQLLSITHLPQIAAKGDKHFKVYKDDTSKETHTRMVLLTPEERLQEIASMLSGSDITHAAMENAKELMG